MHFDEQSLLLRKCSGEAFFCRTDPTGLTDFCAIVLWCVENIVPLQAKVSVTGTSLVAREKALRTMTKKQAIQLFEERKVRTVWDDEQEKWYFSIVDVCDVLTDSKDPTAYWRKLKQRLKEEGNETVTNCHALKMQAADGKMRRVTRCQARCDYE